jgi:hypothetical protein
LLFNAVSRSSNLKSYSPFGANSLAIIGEFQSLKQKHDKKKRATMAVYSINSTINPSNPSIIGWVSVTFLSKSAVKFCAFFHLGNFAKLVFAGLILVWPNHAWQFFFKTGPLPSFFGSCCSFGLFDVVSYKVLTSFSLSKFLV